MSTTRNLLNSLDQFTENFKFKFDFYLDILDKLYNLQSKIGLSESELNSLNDEDQNLIKSYLFLVESANTTSIAALRLFSSNFHSDGYSLIRILYEIGCLLHYGNISSENKREVLYTIFKSTLQPDDHNKEEWKIIQKAERKLESQNPEYENIRKELNNFGGHISRSKVVLGNVTSFNNATASKVFFSNFNSKHLLAGLDFLFSLMMLILDEYCTHLIGFNGVDEYSKNEIEKLPRIFLKEIRPKLQSFIDPNIK